LPPSKTRSLTGYGHLAQFLGEFFPELPPSFKGMVRVSTSSPGISVVGLRSRYNERQTS
jgi:hypothetical protein